ncbi:MAG: 4Fe-4S binding protein [Oscillospiraceae bacterium]|jgi:epoxyqueuosine reductase QueG|nr:4Fe-4S binding protein [Oscillospiraceae bacterium]
MDIKQTIKDLALKYGMDMCGVASVDRFAESPPGTHPEEILPGCKSVIVIGVRLLDGIIQANFRSFEDGMSQLKGLYGTYAYTILPNYELAYACYAVAQTLERATGEVAVPLSTGPMTNGKQISLRHAAVAAGLGEFSWMSIVLTPEFGPRNRFGAILTTAEIEADPMYSGVSLCNNCGICTKVCPTNAIGEYGSDDKHSCKVGEREFTYATVSMPRCYVAEHALRKEFGGKEDLIDNPDPTWDEVNEAMSKLPVSELGLQHADSWHCGRCLSYCPAGKWKQRFRDKNLSKGAGAVS